MVDGWEVLFIGLGSGFGSAMGAEFAKFIVAILKEQRKEKKALKFET